MESSVGHTQNSEAGLMINLASTFPVGQDDSSARGLAQWDFSAAAASRKTCRGKTSGFGRAPGSVSDVWGSCTEAVFKHNQKDVGMRKIRKTGLNICINSRLIRHSVLKEVEIKM